jgi:non-specific serine/threonine protein kinase
MMMEAETGRVLVFGTLLRRYRRAAGLTQEQLAEQTGVSVRTISDLERGVRDTPHQDTILLLATALGLQDADRTVFLAATGRLRAPAPQPLAMVPSSLGPAEHPTNLPRALTSFIGREREQAAILHLLQDVPLLTLTGAGGCGKTRLALMVAGKLLGEYPDGVWLVELASLADPTLVPQTVAQVLGLKEQPGQTPMELLLNNLKQRRLLLVLDNAEHLVGACAELATALLRSCPELRLLATSREALEVAGETLYRVPSLTVPDMDHLPPPDQLKQYEAVRLFMERAQARRADFTLKSGNAGAVAQVCIRLDGMPLAIELAAARVGSLSVEGIAARLDDRFRLLIGGARDALPRQRTLRATLDWSYDLLSVVEQALLRRYSVFAGGWTLAAAEAVCAGDGIEDWEVFDLLDRLVNKSLVQAADPDGEVRYWLLETVRQYGLQQLELANETATLRERHLRWCVTLAEQAAPALLGPKQATWLARLEREHDNLRAALQWALDRGLSTLGLQVAGGLGEFWVQGGYQREGQHWLTALLALAADANDDVVVRATALEAAAWLADARADDALASALFALSGALRRAAGQEERSGWPLFNAAKAARDEGDYASATALLERSLAQHPRMGHRRQPGDRDLRPGPSWGHRYSLLALVLREHGEYARASALCEECLTLARQLGDAEGTAIALLSLADLARDQGDAERVRAYCEESLAVFRDLGQTWRIGFSLNNLALAAYLEGDLTLAARTAAESEALFRGLGAVWGLEEVLVTVGRVKGAQGEAVGAHTCLAEALTLAWAKGPRWVVGAALEELGVQAVQQDREQHGVRLLAAAAVLRQAMGTPVRLVDRPTIEDALAVGCAALGEEGFAAAWAEGRALPLDEAVALALEDTNAALQGQ